MLTELNTKGLSALLEANLTSEAMILESPNSKTIPGAVGTEDMRSLVLPGIAWISESPLMTVLFGSQSSYSPILTQKAFKFLCQCQPNFRGGDIQLLQIV